MTMLTVALFIIIYVALVLLQSLKFSYSKRSSYDLKRIKNDDALRRDKLVSSMLALQRTLVGILAMATAIYGFMLYGSLGVLAAMLLWLVSAFISRLRIVHRLAERIFDKRRMQIYGFVEKHRKIMKFWRLNEPSKSEPAIDSVDHLVCMVENSGELMTDSQKRIVPQALAWHDTAVSDIMTPWKGVASVDSKELLGPLVLDDLHKSGHYRFPAVEKSSQDIVGVLDIRSLVDVSVSNHTQRVDHAMSREVPTVHENELLPLALDVVYEADLQIAIVVDDNSEPVGLLTIANFHDFLFV